MVHSTRSDPPEIRRKLEALQSQKNLIEDLNSRLLAAQTERDRLEKEVYVYRASIAPIRKCPEEVLKMIFEHYLLWNPRLIHRLLLVCWDWHNLAVASPRLWTYIPINFCMDIDAQATCNSIKRRVDRCLKLSRTLPLQLDLDFRELTSSEDRIKSKLYQALENIADPEGHDALYEWLRMVEVDSLDDPEIISACQLLHPFNLLKQLIGEDGEVISRWGSLRIDCPEDPELSMAIMRHFTHPTPKLVRLETRFDLEKWHAPGDQDQVVFPDLSSVEHLEISRLGDLDLLSLVHSSIKSLTVGYVPHWNSSVFAPFTRLQDLEVTSFASNVSDGPSFTKEVLCLPELRRLTIGGFFPNLCHVEFQVPVLDMLHLSQVDPLEPLAYPKVQSKHVTWDIDAFWISEWKPDRIQLDLRVLLLEYRSALRLQVPSCSKKAVCGIIRELKTQGNWSSALKSITFEGESRDLETIEVDTI